MSNSVLGAGDTSVIMVPGLMEPMSGGEQIMA